MEKFSYLGCDGRTTIAGYYYPATTHVIGGVYFAHGVTEYAERHEPLFKALNDAGYYVLANDHMGHGNSISENEAYFSTRGGVSGWDCACRDAYNCIYEGRRKFRLSKDLPLYGIGFSLGSFIVRTLAIRMEVFQGLVLIGTGYQSAIKTALGKFIANQEGNKYGFAQYTEQITKLTFEEYNKDFAGETRVDWLCANSDARNEYLSDTRCTKGFTAGLFYDLLYGMEYTCNRENMQQMTPYTNILLLSGSDDPVGDFGKGVKTLYRKLHKRYNVDYKLYPDMRHDILHEKDAMLVRNDIVNFLNNI